MAECTFCEELNKQIDNAKYNAQPRPGRSEITRTEFGSSLVSDTYYGDHYCGRHYLNGFPLNFCPECGKPIKNTTIPAPEPQ